MNDRQGKSVIDDLWNGELDLHASGQFSTPEMQELLRSITRCHEELSKSFTEEQRALLEQFEDCRSEYDSLLMQATFRSAFKLGARMMMETPVEQSLSPNPDN